jgi:hypothetical protein
VVSPTFSVGAQKQTRNQALVGVWLANVDAWGVHSTGSVCISSGVEESYKSCM